MNTLIHNPGIHDLGRLRTLPGVELIPHESVVSKKMYLHQEIWLRDQVLWIDGVAHETLNTRAQQQYIITSLLTERGVRVETNHYLPFQGGHVLQNAEDTFCASSCAIDQYQHQRGFDRGAREKWGAESLEQFQSGESTRFIRRHLPQATVLPSLLGLPWSYHADLSACLIGKLALLSDPSLFFVSELESRIEEGVRQTERLLQESGYSVLRFPLYFDPAASLFHAPLNGLVLADCFYYTLIDGMTEFNDFVKSYVRENVSFRAEPVFFPKTFLGSGGGLRCLSLQW